MTLTQTWYSNTNHDAESVPCALTVIWPEHIYLQPTLTMIVLQDPDMPRKTHTRCSMIFLFLCFMHIFKLSCDLEFWTEGVFYWYFCFASTSDVICYYFDIVEPHYRYDFSDIIIL